MRLIDVDALGVGRCSKEILPAAYCAGWNGLLGILEKADTVDAVVVTRCKDCKHYLLWKHSRAARYCTKHVMPMPCDGFCSYGEPKEENND